jgi:hypothetical protein
MKKIEFGDVVSLESYEKIRPDVQRRVIDVKKRRRVQVGPRVSLLFENRDTVLYQIQEMVRTERLRGRERIQEEIDVYNALIPADGELSATLFIEFEDSSQLPAELPKFIGIETAVSLQIGDGSFEGVPDEIRSKEDTTSTVHYLRFRLSPEGQQALDNGHEDASVVIAHPNYDQTVKLDQACRAELAGDLRSS